MLTSISLGPVPAEEDCEQLGPNYNAVTAKNECKRYIAAIIQVCGHPPTGAKLKISSNPHDFGTYFDVEVEYNDEDDIQRHYALRVENDAPKEWPEIIPDKPIESVKLYLGRVPEQCDLCKCLIINTFIDGVTKMGPWANMCPSCHASHGRGLGIGKGQMYSKRADGRWEKV